MAPAILINYNGGMPNDPLVSVRGERARVPLPLRAAGRYLITGASLRGPGDNATFLHAATVDYRARPYLTLTGPLWQRLARRNGAITVPVLMLSWTAADAALAPLGWSLPGPEPQLWHVLTYEGLLLLAAFCWSVVRARRGLRDRKRNAEYVDPAARTLCKILKRRYVKREARRLISIPRGWGQDEGGTVRIFFPDDTVFTKAMRAQIVTNVGAKLGLPNAREEWAENNAWVELSPPPLPSDDPVTLESLAAALAECPEDEIVCGRLVGNRVMRISLADDSPHLAMSGTTGSGKSVFIRWILRQRLMRGEGVMILDPKRFSHMRWANQFPRERLLYAVTDEELHEAWLAIGDEIARRIALPLDELEHQRRVWIVAEEINAQIKKLTRYWKGVRQGIVRPARALLADCEKACGGSKQEGLAMALDQDPDIMAKLDPPATSPAVVALQESVFMGRELKMHMIVAAQRLEAAVFGGGGGAVRGSFGGGRFMAKWDKPLWKMLADGIPYMAWPGGKRGIWGVARQDTFEIFRVPWLDESAMSDVLVSGQPVYGPVLGQQGDVPVLDMSVRTSITAGVSLAAAVGQLPRRTDGSERTLDSLQRASTRPGFPMSVGQEGKAKLYDLAELEAWSAR